MDVQAIPKNDFGSKLKSILGQTANLTGQAAGAIGRFAVNTTTDIAKTGYRAGKTLVELQTQPMQAEMYRQMGQDLGNKQDSVMKAYKEGKMSKDEYVKALRDIGEGFKDVTKQNDQLIQGPTPGQRAMDVVETATNVLSLGSLSLTNVAGKQVIKNRSRAAIQEIIEKEATNLEKKLIANKGIRELVTRNIQATAKREAQILAGESGWQFTQRNAKKIAVDLMIKRPVFYEQNIGQAQSLYNNILEGDYKGALTDAAWLSTQMINGGPIGAIAFLGGKAGSTTRKLARGNESFIDNLSVRFGSKNKSQIAEYIAKNPEAEKTWRIIQESNLRASGDRVGQATDNFMSTYSYMSDDQLAKLTPEQITKDIQNWYDADQIIQRNASKLGLKPGEAARLTPVRWDAATRTSVADAVKDATTTTRPIDEDTGKIFYHGTDNTTLKRLSDLESGKGVGKSSRNRVYVTENPELAKRFGSNVIEERLYGKHLDVREIGIEKTPGWAADNVVAAEFADYKTTELLTAREKRVFENQFVKGVPNNTIIEDTPGIHKYLASKGYTTITVPRVASDVDGLRSETIIIDSKAFVKPSATMQSTPGDKAAQIAAIEAFTDNPSAGFTANKNLMDNITKIIETSDSAEIAAKRIQAIDAAVSTPARVPKRVRDQLAKLGYTVAEPQGGRTVESLDIDDTRKLISGAIKDENLFDPSAAPAPLFKQIAGTMERFGVSPEESNRLAYRKVSETVAANLRNTVAGAELGFKTGDDIARGGEVVLSKLQMYVENLKGVPGLRKLSAGKSAVVDIRQLTLDEISDALKYKEGGKLKSISKAQAKEVREAIIKGYGEVPMEMRGLGEKAVDVLYQYNPLHKYYSRIQSSLRYTYNPFFRLQELSETKILSKVKANNLVWRKSRAELDDAAKILDEARIFSGALPGEGMNDMVIGRITANMTQGQKRDLAGLALDIADSQGKDLAQLAAENPEILDDALRVIVQYPRKGVLASPLARTLNLVFFPMRYNAKVTMVAAEALGKQPASVQKAVLHSLFTTREWLKSDEGIEWQSKNADVISLLSWITPVNSIKSTLQLLSGNVQSWGDLGQLGGLPLGVISQILDGQGIISLNRPYVDPKTGKVFPDYVPESAKARAATALVDMLNSTFTYPGRILGLPGKNQMLRGFVENFIATEGSDFEKRIQTDRLTPLQKNWVRVLGGDTSEEAVDALYNSPDEGQFNGYTLPPYNLPIKPKPPELPKKVRKGRGGKGKKAKTYARAPGPR